jgi:hypothetical protein
MTFFVFKIQERLEESIRKDSNSCFRLSHFQALLCLRGENMTKIFLPLILFLLLGCGDDDEEIYQINQDAEISLPERCCENGLKITYEDSENYRSWVCDDGSWRIED